MNKNPRIRVAGILIRDGKILLIKHQKKDKEYWLLPGGGVDYGEEFSIALKREFKEETNIDIEVKDMVFISESIAPDLRRHIVNIFFLVNYHSGKLKIGDEHILKELKFIEINKLEDITLYPNIKGEIIENYNSKNIKIQYLGNRWE